MQKGDLLQAAAAVPRTSPFFEYREGHEDEVLQLSRGNGADMDDVFYDLVEFDSKKGNFRFKVNYYPIKFRPENTLKPVSGEVVT